MSARSAIAPSGTWGKWQNTKSNVCYDPSGPAVDSPTSPDRNTLSADPIVSNMRQQPFSGMPYFDY
jgi:hypothetical protein